MLANADKRGPPLIEHWPSSQPNFQKLTDDLRVAMLVGYFGQK